MSKRKSVVDPVELERDTDLVRQFLELGRRLEFTQVELADQIDGSQTTISRWQGWFAAPPSGREEFRMLRPRIRRAVRSAIEVLSGFDVARNAGPHYTLDGTTAAQFTIQQMRQYLDRLERQIQTQTSEVGGNSQSPGPGPRLTAKEAAARAKLAGVRPTETPEKNRTQGKYGKR